MNIEKLLESVNRIESEKAYIVSQLPENTAYLFRGLSLEIESIRKSLTDEQRRMNASKAGYNVEYKAACRLLKQAANNSLKQAWANAKGQICACDGYVGVRLTDPKYALPMANNRVMDLDTIMDTVAQRATGEENLPDVADLKTYLKVITAKYKAEHSAKELSQIKDRSNGRLPIYYRFESNGAYVSIELLLLALEIVPDGRAYTSPSTVQAVYIKGENAEAVVLPIRVTETTDNVIRADADSAALRSGTYFDGIPA